MKSAQLLLLLLCVEPGRTQAPGAAAAAAAFEDGREELWGLKQLMLSLRAAQVEQRQAQRSAESRLRDREVEAEQQKRRLDALEAILGRQREEQREAEASLRRRVEELQEESEGGAKHISHIYYGT